MKHIDEAILNYVEQKNTDYAVLLTGKWGSGKTYYLNNTLKGKIEEKGFKMIVISLYGVSTIKEVSTMIFAERSPKLAGMIKYAGPIVKSFFKSVDIADYLKFGIDEIDGNKDTNTSINQEKVVDEASSWFGKFTAKKQENGDIKEKEIILCFDDLERKNEVLINKEIMGYINNFTENGTKIIVLADEDKIESNDEFKKLKEKTFGLSLEFEQKQEDTIKEIIKRGFEEDKIFNTFLEGKIDYIGDLFFKHSKNLRILKFGLNCFHTIFNQIEIEKYKFPNLNLNETYDQILKFVIAIAIEFREGVISFENKKGIDKKYPENDIYEFLEKNMKGEIQQETQEKPKQEDKYRNEFIKKYFYDYNSSFNFYSSIYNYITSGYLDKDLLLQNLINEDRKAIRPEYQALDKVTNVGFWNLRKFSDEELKPLLEKIITYAYQGLYGDIVEYLKIFYIASLYADSYEFDLKQISENLLDTIEKKVLKEILSQNLENFQSTHRYIKEENYNKETNALGDKICELINKELVIRLESITKNINSGSLKELLETLETDIQTPTLRMLNVTELLSKLNNSDNDLLSQFHLLLAKRYNTIYGIYEQIHQKDLKFIKELEKLLRSREVKQNEKNRNDNFNAIIKVLNSTIEKLEKE